jgi:hypothetical protein
VETVEAAPEPGANRPERRVVPEFVSLVYGGCNPDPRCAPPLEIQVWRSCNRSLDDYELAPGTPYPHKELLVRGTKAAVFDDRIELYAGTVTIVLFGEQGLTLRAAQALRPLNSVAGREASGLSDGLLPPPARAASCA